MRCEESDFKSMMIGTIREILGDLESEQDDEECLEAYEFMEIHMCGVEE